MAAQIVSIVIFVTMFILIIMDKIEKPQFVDLIGFTGENRILNTAFDGTSAPRKIYIYGKLPQKHEGYACVTLVDETARNSLESYRE